MEITAAYFERKKAARLEQANAGAGMRKSIKAGDLKRAFAAIPDDTDVSFGPALGNHIGSLTYYRTKRVGDNLVNVQFNEDFEVTSDPWEEMQKPQSDDSGPTLP